MARATVMPSDYVDPNDAKMFEKCTKKFKPLHEMHKLHEYEAGKHLKCFKRSKISVKTIRNMLNMYEKGQEKHNVYDFFINQLKVIPSSGLFNLNEKFPELKTKRSNGAPMREPLQTRINDYIECLKSSNGHSSVLNDPLNIDLKEVENMHRSPKGCMKQFMKNRHESMYMDHLMKNNSKLFGEFGRKGNVVGKIMKNRFNIAQATARGMKPEKAYVPTGKDDFWGYSKPKNTKPVLDILNESADPVEAPNDKPDIAGISSPVEPDSRFPSSAVAKKPDESDLPEDTVNLPADLSDDEIEFEERERSIGSLPDLDTSSPPPPPPSKDYTMVYAALVALLIICVTIGVVVAMK